MRQIQTFLLLATCAYAGPSDFLRYEATKNGGRATLRTHTHAFGADGYRPVSPGWNDLPAILALSVPTAGKFAFKLTLHKAGECRVKGKATVGGSGATAEYKFSAKNEDELAILDGVASVEMKIDPDRHLVKAAQMTLRCTLVRKGKKEQIEQTWTYELHSERLHGAAGFQKSVEAAIDKGVAFLKGRQKDDGSFGPRHEFAIGTTALCLFTLSSCGVALDDPVIKKGLANILGQTPGKTYDRAVALMALDRAYTPPGELARAHRNPVKTFKRELSDTQRAWAFKVAADLERLCSAPGSWAYGKRKGEDWPDSSNTQYAVLGLRAAARMGYKAEPRTWLGVIQHFRALRGKEQLSGTLSLVREGEAVTAKSTRAGEKVHKKEGRGFRYRSDYKKTTATMSTAAIASMLIAREELQRLRYRIKPKTNKEIERSILGAWLWLDRNWAMARAPGHHPAHHRQYYYLYSVERAAVLDRVKRVGAHDWYFEGAAWLLDQQRKSGSWVRENAKDDVNTCFALLFLKRATAPLTLTR